MLRSVGIMGQFFSSSLLASNTEPILPSLLRVRVLLDMASANRIF